MYQFHENRMKTRCGLLGMIASVMLVAGTTFASQHAAAHDLSGLIASVNNTVTYNAPIYYDGRRLLAFTSSDNYSGNSDQAQIEAGKRICRVLGHEDLVESVAEWPAFNGGTEYLPHFGFLVKFDDDGRAFEEHAKTKFACPPGYWWSEGTDTSCVNATRDVAWMRHYAWAYFTSITCRKRTRAGEQFSGTRTGNTGMNVTSDRNHHDRTYVGVGSGPRASGARAAK